jgi:hypothetical protein
VGQITDAGGDSLVVTSVGNGTTPIIAMSGDVTGSTQLVVSQVAKSANVEPKSIVLGIDGRARLTPSLYDVGGAPMAFSAREVQWGVEGSPSIAEVDTLGEVHAKGFGVTGIYAVVQGIRSPSATIDVSDAAPSVLTFSADTLTASPDGSTVSVYLSLATPVTVTVTLSDPLGLVKFDKDTLIFDQGRTSNDVTIYGLTNGRTTIVASDEGKLFASDSMTVFVGKGGIVVDSVPKIIPPARLGIVTTAAGSQTITVKARTTGGATRDRSRSPVAPERTPRTSSSHVEPPRNAL